jgi:hypothetical protein
MATSSFCYPPFHTTFAPLVGGRADAFLNSGCGFVGADIACPPETMRASAERQLQASGLWPANKPLDLGTYTLARNIQSEVGSSTVEERVALGESTVNQGLRRGATTRSDAANRAALFAQPSHLYGLINAPGGGSAGTGRFTSTSADPTILTTLLADFIINGQSGNFAQGADDQDGLEFRSSFAIPMNRVLQYASSGSYWVGPLPGVDHWRLSLFRNFGFSSSSPQGLFLIERARAVFGNPVYEGNRVAQSMRPVWPANLPICTATDTAPSTGRSGFANFMIGMAAVGGLVGLGWLSLRVAKNLATSGTFLGAGHRGLINERRR